MTLYSLLFSLQKFKILHLTLFNHINNEHKQKGDVCILESSVTCLTRRPSPLRREIEPTPGLRPLVSPRLNVRPQRNRPMGLGQGERQRKRRNHRLNW